jgi:hypothetical protein
MLTEYVPAGSGPVIAVVVKVSLPVELFGPWLTDSADPAIGCPSR